MRIKSTRSTFSEGATSAMIGVVRCGLMALTLAYMVTGKLESEDATQESDDGDVNESSERIGATVTQINHHPYAAALMKNGNYSCSAVILNNYWLLTLSKCFDGNVVSSYVTHRNLVNFTVRVGSSYNNKAGYIYKIKMLTNNFDLRVTALKVEMPIVFNSQVKNVQLPDPGDEVQLGYLASIIAWTPNGHMRVVNAPLIQDSICEPYTKMLPVHYVCVGGVQDPNRHFCRRDNGGAVIQNNTLIGISLFVNHCALYIKPHAFPKVSSFARWLNSVIWDEGNRPTTSPPLTTTPTTKKTENVTARIQSQTHPLPSKYLLTLPFDPINVPLEPAEGNSVIPRMSLYESYLQSLTRAKTSTTTEENNIRNGEMKQKEISQKYNKALMMMSPQMFLQTSNQKKFDHYKYD